MPASPPAPAPHKKHGNSDNARPRCREPAPTCCSSSPATTVLRSMEQRPKHSRLPGRPVRGADLLHRSAPKSCAREPGVLSAANELWRQHDLRWSVHIHTYALLLPTATPYNHSREKTKESFVDKRLPGVEGPPEGVHPTPSCCGPLLSAAHSYGQSSTV